MNWKNIFLLNSKILENTYSLEVKNAMVEPLKKCKYCKQKGKQGTECKSCGAVI